MEDRIYDVLDEPSPDIHKGEINAYEGVIEYLKEMGLCHVSSEHLIKKLEDEVKLSQRLEMEAQGLNQYRKGIVFALGKVLSFIDRTGIGEGENMSTLVNEINRNLENEGVKAL